VVCGVVSEVEVGSRLFCVGLHDPAKREAADKVMVFFMNLRLDR
jgi:hypothetical protein